MNESKSAFEIFEKLIESVSGKKVGKQPKVYLAAQSVADISPEKWALVEKWLGDPAMQDVLQNANSSRTTVGVVIDVRNIEKTDRSSVDYIDQNGLWMAFAYDPKEPWFRGAPEGFKVGDIIINKFTKGVDMESVKQIRLNREQKFKVISQIKEKYESLHKRLSQE